jgi:formylglycine-generating enzyme
VIAIAVAVGGCARLSPSPSIPDSLLKTNNESVLIKGDDFRMGHDSTGDHAPGHTVHVDSFYLDRHEVTNTQYLTFCQARGHTLPEFWGMTRYCSGQDFPDHPVIGISWQDAQAYCRWVGKRLPTEAEWEYASRGGLRGRPYPKGKTISPADGNYSKSDHQRPVAVGSYAPNGYGLYDMQGNVVEWVSDRYDPAYYASSPTHNPQGPKQGKLRVIRGGGWHSGPTCNRVYFRNALPANWVDINVGFRCAQDANND